MNKNKNSPEFCNLTIWTFKLLTEQTPSFHSTLIWHKRKYNFYFLLSDKAITMSSNKLSCVNCTFVQLEIIK